MSTICSQITKPRPGRSLTKRATCSIPVVGSRDVAERQLRSTGIGIFVRQVVCALTCHRTGMARCCLRYHPDRLA